MEMLSAERWAILPEGGDRYEISNHGRVRRVGSPKELSGSISEEGYRLFWVYTSPKTKKKMYTHRAVWLAFRGHIPKGYHIDHVDADCTNNHINNLQMLSPADHCRKTSRDNPQRGAKTGDTLSRPVWRVKRGSEGEEDEVQLFSSLREAAAKSDVYYSNIIRYIRDGIACGVYHWEYSVDEDEDEEWVELPADWNGLKASTKGRIRYPKNGRITSGYVNQGYLHVGYRGKHIKVHTLVCIAFHGAKPDWASSVNHKDRNTLNNEPNNLEWADASMQVIREGVEVYEFASGAIVSSHKSMKDAAEALAVSPARISNAVRLVAERGAVSRTVGSSTLSVRRAGMSVALRRRREEFFWINEMRLMRKMDSRSERKRGVPSCVYKDKGGYMYKPTRFSQRQISAKVARGGLSPLERVTAAKRTAEAAWKIQTYWRLRKAYPL
jgi:hypothetical protein